MEGASSAGCARAREGEAGSSSAVPRKTCPICDETLTRDNETRWMCCGQDTCINCADQVKKQKEQVICPFCSTRMRKAKIMQRLRVRARNGDVEAQFDLGTLLDTDKVSAWEANRRAAYWYRRAADQGHADAQYNLGCMYAKGLGVEHDNEEARRWWHRAAEQGQEEACASIRAPARPRKRARDSWVGPNIQLY